MARADYALRLICREALMRVSDLVKCYAPSAPVQASERPPSRTTTQPSRAIDTVSNQAGLEGSVMSRAGHVAVVLTDTQRINRVFDIVRRQEANLCQIVPGKPDLTGASAWHIDIARTQERYHLPEQLNRSRKDPVFSERTALLCTYEATKGALPGQVLVVNPADSRLIGGGVGQSSFKHGTLPLEETFVCAFRGLLAGLEEQKACYPLNPLHADLDRDEGSFKQIYCNVDFRHDANFRDRALARTVNDTARQEIDRTVKLLLQSFETEAPYSTDAGGAPFLVASVAGHDCRDARDITPTDVGELVYAHYAHIFTEASKRGCTTVIAVQPTTGIFAQRTRVPGATPDGEVLAAVANAARRAHADYAGSLTVIYPNHGQRFMQCLKEAFGKGTSTGHTSGGPAIAGLTPRGIANSKGHQPAFPRSAGTARVDPVPSYNATRRSAAPPPDGGKSHLSVPAQDAGAKRAQNAHAAETRNAHRFVVNGMEFTRSTGKVDVPLCLRPLFPKPARVSVHPIYEGPTGLAQDVKLKANETARVIAFDANDGRMVIACTGQPSSRLYAVTYAMDDSPDWIRSDWRQKVINGHDYVISAETADALKEELGLRGAQVSFHALLGPLNLGDGVGRDILVLKDQRDGTNRALIRWPDKTGVLRYYQMTFSARDAAVKQWLDHVECKKWMLKEMNGRHYVVSSTKSDALATALGLQDARVSFHPLHAPSEPMAVSTLPSLLERDATDPRRALIACRDERGSPIRVEMTFSQRDKQVSGWLQRLPNGGRP